MVTNVDPPAILFSYHDAVFGEDARLFISGKRVFVVFNCLDKSIRANRLMRILEILPEIIDNLVFSVGPIMVLDPNEGCVMPEKNWVPFSAGDSSELLFIRYMTPSLIVVKIELPSRDTVDKLVVLNAQNHSISALHPYLALAWKYGELRGGTPLIALNSSHFISMFHSYGNFRSSDIRTYFFGLVVVQVDIFPFKIVGISKIPIKGPTWYQGMWMNSAFDYVYYPGSIHIDGSFLHVAYGRQDYYGWIAKLNLSALLSEDVAFI